MVTKTETLPYAEGFILSEAPGYLSREQITIGQNAGGVMYPGTVLGYHAGSGKYLAYDSVATTGAQDAVAILCNEVDPTDGDVKATVIERLAEVNGGEIKWPAGISANDKAAGIADLLTKNIKVRPAPTTISTQAY